MIRLTRTGLKNLIRNEIASLNEAWSKRSDPEASPHGEDFIDIIADDAIATKVDELVDVVVARLDGTPQEAAMLRDSINDGIKVGLQYVWS